MCLARALLPRPFLRCKQHTTPASHSVVSCECKQKACTHTYGICPLMIASLMRPGFRIAFVRTPHGCTPGLERDGRDGGDKILSWLTKISRAVDSQRDFRVKELGVVQEKVNFLS
jgi:hypothetical protein